MALPRILAPIVAPILAPILALSGLVPLLAAAGETFGLAVTGAPGPSGERLTLDDDGLTLRFPDDAAKLRIGGRLQLDFGAAGIRRPGSPQPGIPDPFPDDFAVRRSWIESYLTLGKDLELAFQYDFADATTPIQDAAVGWRGIPDTILTLGNMKEPFSLEYLENNTTTLFTERSLALAFVPLRDFGFSVGRRGADWTVVAGAYGGNANTGLGTQGVAATARATYAPIRTDRQVLHLGLAASYRGLQRADMPVNLDAIPEAFLFRRALVGTGDIDASAIGRIGAEAAYLDGPLLVQAEYIRTEVARFDGARTLGFQGGYVQAGYVVNGRRGYRMSPDYATSYGVFSGVSIDDGQRVSQGGPGAFEFGVRFSAIDLQDRDVRGGREQDLTLGVNWYPDHNIRLMADYVRSHASPSSLPGGRTVDADILIGRLQLYW